MKCKKTALLLAMIMSIGVTGCGKQSDSINQSNTVEQQSMQETVVTEETQMSEKTQDTVNALQERNHVLIAYFTWADNTHVEDSESIDADATTSASVLPPGNAALLANWIQEDVGGDMFSIVVEEPYSSDYDECLDRAAQEAADEARPALVNHVENMESYDTIFLGLPNWWYGAPMAVLSFLEEYDFSGKTIIPFITHGTGGLADTMDDIESALPEDITMLEPIGVYRPEVADSKPQIQEWIAGLGIEFETKEVEETSMTNQNNQISIQFRDREIVVNMEENTASKNFIEQLPMTLEFEDYNSTEKIAYMDETLDYGDSPNRCNALAGTMAYYIPWGNISLFYDDFRESDQLVPLGIVESGLEYISEIEDGETLTIEVKE